MGINWGLWISNIVALDVDDVKGKTYVQITKQKTGKQKKMFVNEKLKPMIAEYTKGKKTVKLYLWQYSETDLIDFLPTIF